MSRVVISGASGNIGSALVPALLASGHHPVALARRPPRDADGAEWVRADLSTSDGQQALTRALRGADAYVHLAWPLQPMRRPGLLHDRGPRMLLPCVTAALEAGVGKVVHLSSVAAYAPGSGGERVDESWPLEGAADSPYARGKVLGERRLDVLARSRSAMDRVAVLRPCLVGQRRAGAQMARYGLPAVLAATRAVRHLPWVPRADGFALQMVHSDDVARAVVATIEQDASGPFNLAGEGTLGGREIARALDARPVRLPRGLPRLAVAAAWHTHLGPLDPTWVDMAVQAPLVVTGRARSVLGWRPEHPAVDVLREVVAGMRSGAGGASAALRPAGSDSEARGWTSLGSVARRSMT